MNPLLQSINTPSSSQHHHVSQPSIYDDNNINTSSRHRQTYPLPVTPGLQRNDYNQSEMKDTQIVSPNYDNNNNNNNQYHPNGGSFNRNHRNSYSIISTSTTIPKDTTLSNFLHTLFLNAKSTINKNTTRSTHSLSTSTSTSSPRSSSSSFNKFTLPSSSTTSFISLCSLWYLSSALSSNTGKVILTQFRFPVTLTIVQFIFVAGYSVLFLAFKERLSHIKGDGGSVLWNGKTKGGAGTLTGGGKAGGSWGSWGIKKPTKVMFQSTLIMSLFQIAGHIFSSMAIQRVPVSTVHTIKALSPLFTVASYAVLFKVRYGSSTYTALAPLTLGVMLACSFDLRANAVGLICALGSTIVFVSQNIFLKKLLPKENKEPGVLTGNNNTSGSSNSSGSLKLDKLNLLFYSSGTAFILTIPIWLYSDISSILSLPPSLPLPLGSPSPPSLLIYFFLNGTTNFAQNLIAFSILSRTSPVTYSIASLVKRIAVICLAIIWSGQSVSLVQGLGMGLTFVGLGMYNNAKLEVEIGERKRVLVEKKADGGYLPSTVMEARELEGSGRNTPVLPMVQLQQQQQQQLQQQQIQLQLQQQQQRFHERRSTMGNLNSSIQILSEGGGGGNTTNTNNEKNGSPFNIPFPTPPTSPIRRPLQL